MDDRAHCSTGGGVGGGATGHLMMLQGAPRTGIAAKTRPRPAAGPASFPVDRSLYFYRHIGIPLEPPGENEFHKVSHEVFYVRAKKL